MNYLQELFMAKSKPLLRRIMWIDQQLRVKRGANATLPNCKTLARGYSDEFESVSEKTIQRDINFLRELGVPVEFDRQPERNGYYYTEENVFLPAFHITESEVFFTCIADRALQQYKNTPLYDKLQSVFEKIQTLFPAKVTVDAAWMNNVRISFAESPLRENDVQIWETISKALYRNQSLLIKHRKLQNPDLTIRRIDPYHLFGREGDWYLLCYDHPRDKHKGGIKMFAINRIEHAEKLSSTFSMPDDFDVSKYTGTMGVMREEKPYNLRIEFDSYCAPYIKERKWNPGQMIKQNKDGTIIFSSPAETTHKDHILQWIMSWGEHAKVISPKSLIDRMKISLSKSLQNYE
jgi:proteasome accessory factor B